MPLIGGGWGGGFSRLVSLREQGHSGKMTWLGGPKMGEESQGVEKSKEKREGVKGLLDELPLPDRLKIKAQALWDVCPHSVQGALVFAGLAPWISLALIMLTKLDPLGYQLRWGKPDVGVLMVVPALLLSAIFMPLARGVEALRKGGLWAEYSSAISGVNAITGKKDKTSPGVWAFFGWLWVIAVFISWLDERSYRLEGVVSGVTIPWHVFNVARIEMCLLIFVTIAAAGLSKAGVFKSSKRASQGQTKVCEGVEKADWSKLGAGLKSGVKSIKAWWKESVDAERSKWLQGKKQHESSRLKAWGSWWSQAPFVIRTLSMSSVAFLMWWGVGEATSRLMDPDWAQEALTKMSWIKAIMMVGLAGVLARLMSKRQGEKWGTGLWFGPGGPSMMVWLGFALGGIVLDRLSALRMAVPAMCFEARFAGGGYFVVIFFWLAVVWGGDVMAWLGGHFEKIAKEAREEGELDLVSLWKVAIKRWGSARVVAGQVRVKMNKAMEQKVLENEADLVRALKKELEDSVPEASKKGRGTSRL